MQIQQLFPAPGWKALMVARGPDGEVVLGAMPLVGWALCDSTDEDGHHQHLEGLIAGDMVTPCESEESFLTYVSDDTNLEAWRDEAIALLEANEQDDRETRWSNDQRN